MGDPNGLLLSGGLILGRNLDDAIGIDVEGHFDLGHATGSGGDAVEDEGAQGLVAAGHLALALEDVDLHLGLPVGGCRK